MNHLCEEPHEQLTLPSIEALQNGVRQPGHHFANSLQQGAPFVSDDQDFRSPILSTHFPLDKVFLLKNKQCLTNRRAIRINELAYSRRVYSREITNGQQDRKLDLRYIQPICRSGKLSRGSLMKTSDQKAGLRINIFLLHRNRYRDFLRGSDSFALPHCGRVLSNGKSSLSESWFKRGMRCAPALPHRCTSLFTSSECPLD
jgi:hypothetical protein